MAAHEIVPFTDAHLDDASALLAARHERHREAEPLLPALADPREAVEREWRAEGASGVFAGSGYLFGAPLRVRGTTLMRVGIAGQATEGDRERMRDLYAVAGRRWLDEGLAKHDVFVPSHDAELVDAWFRLSFGASAVLALRETGPNAEEPFDAGVTIRPGTAEDFDEAARLDLEMTEALREAPSFSKLPLQTHAELTAEWREELSELDKLFVAERDGRIVGLLLLYRRPPDLRVAPSSIDLAQASTEPAARGTGVGRALTEHAIRWAHNNGHPVMTTDWRMTNLWASRFWPRRGFRPAFLRVFRSIP
jgi:GNAT superfamily N-acetyltransferase